MVGVVIEVIVLVALRSQLKSSSELPSKSYSGLSFMSSFESSPVSTSVPLSVSPSRPKALFVVEAGVGYTDSTTTKVENCEGLIGIYNNTSGEKVSQALVLYSNFGTCNINFNIEQQECQLWAYENATNDDIQECLVTYKTLCDGEIYEVYNSTCLT
ncbi:uncharacterized protein ISCGN_018204 [Ixodes scapularis]